MSLQLQQNLQRAVRDANRLKVSLEEKQRSAEETEQQLRRWAQLLGAECQLFRHLVEPEGAKQCSEPSPPRYYYYFLMHFLYTTFHLFSIPASYHTLSWKKNHIILHLFLFFNYVGVCVY